MRVHEVKWESTPSLSGECFVLLDLIGRNLDLQIFLFAALNEIANSKDANKVYKGGFEKPLDKDYYFLSCTSLTPFSAILGLIKGDEFSVQGSGHK